MHPNPTMLCNWGIELNWWGCYSNNSRTSSESPLSLCFFPFDKLVKSTEEMTLLVEGMIQILTGESTSTLDPDKCRVFTFHYEKDASWDDNEVDNSLDKIAPVPSEITRVLSLESGSVLSFWRGILSLSASFAPTNWMIQNFSMGLTFSGGLVAFRRRVIKFSSKFFFEAIAMSGVMISVTKLVTI